MGDVSNEDIVRIATDFLLNAPPGEFMEVVTDVRALLPNESLLNASALSTFREYNTEQMVQVTSPGNKHQVLISKVGEVSDGEYLDPRGRQVVQYDHIKQEVTGSRPLSGELDADVEPFRAAFDQEASRYVDEHYSPNGATGVYGKKEGGNYVITVCISSSKFNPNNYWNGRWRSIWTATFKPGGQVQLQGSLKVNVHYYEDGNVQLNTQTTRSASVAGNGNAPDLAKEVMKNIIKLEQGLHASLDTSYNTMGDTTFKALRRALPITRAKIDWNKIRTYKLGQEMGK
eukprot:TRINITY_DN646_c0_g1_i1.p1 TRINITY_DN646_c0_g1~~TRINITY_DN646_c0_g1_i1.p1  ORF type:complete len:287 (+),score=92.58 TRINITY_DN646_c0_g1_i1:57-917(+)